MPMPSKTRDGKRHCGTCDTVKELTEFYQRPDGHYRSECKPCWRVRCDNHKKAHSDWMDTLKDGPCTDCGVQYAPWVMQWDHLPQFEKTMGVGVMRARRLGREKVLAEIAKCELVCANCHGVRTYNRLTPEEQELVF